jgi:lipopolysaccharide assembly outer membrane protein LptD (OstA)
MFTQSDTLDYWADRVEYSVRDSSIMLSGNSQIIYQNIKLNADTIIYFTNNKTMIASGNPILIDGKDTLRGKHIAYNIQSRSGKIRYGLMYSDDDVAYYAQNIVRTDSAIYAHHGFYTTCMFPDQPHSHFYCERIKLLPGDKTIARPFVLVVGDAPMAALPFFIIPLEKDRASGWLPIRWGVALNGRGNVDNIGYYWAINDYLDLMLAGRVDNFDNFLVKAETNYRIKDILSGNIYSDYSIDDKYMGRHNRWSLRFNHDQNLLPDRSFTLKGSGRLASDKRYSSDFSDNVTEITDQNLSSNLSLTKRLDNIGGHTSLSWNRSQKLQHEIIEQDLPTVNFTLNNRPLLPPIFGDTTQNPLANLSWNYSFRANQKIFESTKIDSSYHKIHRGMSHSIPISMPFNVFNHIRITPNFTVNQAFFDSYIDTVAVLDTIFEILFDTISIDHAHHIEYAGMKKDTIHYPNIISPDTIIIRVHRDSTLRVQRRHDTTYYHHKNFDLNKAHNVWWNTGVNISTNLYGIFPVKFGRMQGIRHTLSPNIGYLFTPKNDLDVRFPSVGVGTPPLGTAQRQEFLFGVNNNLETKILNPPKNDDEKASERRVNLLTAGISGSYNFEADSQKLSNISIRGSVPAPKVDLSYSGSYHPYDMSNKIDFPKPLSHAINITPQLPSLQGNIWSGDLIIHNGFQEYGYLDNVFKNNNRDWSINITPRYSYSLTRENVVSEFRANKNYTMGAGMSFMLSQRWKMSWGGTWSFTENTFINQNVALSADLECWDLRLDWYPTGVNEGRIYFVAALKRHRDLKWEQRER